jgi:hypothetical protein
MTNKTHQICCYTRTTAIAQKRLGTPPLCDKIKPNTMKTLKIILLVLLAAALTPLFQAQAARTFSFTANRVVPDANYSGMEGADSAGLTPIFDAPSTGSATRSYRTTNPSV